MNNKEFLFVVGSQFLYGPEVLDTVAARAAEMADKLNASGNLPCKLVYKVTAKTNKEIADVVKQANYDDNRLGVIAWCHTFSPSKMWINGFVNLQKPYCHFATQYNREIPNEEIDMDFMNLNQAAHGDREHGFIAARLRMPRKVIAGYWQDEDVQKRLGAWMQAAVGVAVSKQMKVMRFGDNMREVAVTEGDKVEVQAKLGWQVNTWPVGKLVETMNAVTDAEIDGLMDEYKASYDFATGDLETVRYQARKEGRLWRQRTSGPSAPCPMGGRWRRLCCAARAPAAPFSPTAARCAPSPSPTGGGRGWTSCWAMTGWRTTWCRTSTWAPLSAGMPTGLGTAALPWADRTTPCGPTTGKITSTAARLALTSRSGRWRPLPGTVSPSPCAAPMARRAIRATWKYR